MSRKTRALRNTRDFSVVDVKGVPVAVQQRHVSPLVAAGMTPQAAAQWVAETFFDNPEGFPLKLENKIGRVQHAARKLAEEQEALRQAEVVGRVRAQEAAAADLEEARREMNELQLGYGSDESAATLRARAKVKRAQMAAAAQQAVQLELITAEAAAQPDLKSVLLAALLEKMSAEDLARMLLGQPAPTPQAQPAPAPTPAPTGDKVGRPVIEYHKCRAGATYVRFDRKLSRGSAAHAVMVKKLHFVWRQDKGCWMGNGHVTRHSIETLLAKAVK